MVGGEEVGGEDDGGEEEAWDGDGEKKPGLRYPTWHPLLSCVPVFGRSRGAARGPRRRHSLGTVTQGSEMTTFVLVSEEDYNARLRPQETDDEKRFDVKTPRKPFFPTLPPRLGYSSLYMPHAMNMQLHPDA